MRETLMRQCRSKIVFLIILVLAFITSVGIFYCYGEISSAPLMGTQAQEDEVVRGVMDIHSNLSDGEYLPEKIAQLAKENGLRVLIFGDSALRKWEYGLWPFRNILKKTMSEKSVLRMGTGKYLQRIATLKKEFPDLVIIPGLEVNPFYYWQGNPLSKNFSLNDWYKEFLIIGLKDKDYQNLPIVGNFSFVCRSKFNQYQGGQGIKPYQDLIDYVNGKRGLIFWSHPEMENLQRYKGIEIYTPEHPEDLFLSQDYTGFGVTFTDRLKIADTGGVWDKLLLEYNEGKRKKPVWIIGSLHYDGPLRKLDVVETLFFVGKINREEDILDALRQGRMYVRFNFGNPPIVLREFSIKNIGSNSIQITIKGTQFPSAEPARIEIIRNGKVIAVFDEQGEEFAIIYTDKTDNQERLYYRLKISSLQGLILSNPLFTFKK